MNACTLCASQAGSHEACCPNHYLNRNRKEIAMPSFAIPAADAIDGHCYTPRPAAVRAFATGATRSADAGRYDPEGFISPIVTERFCVYMQVHRVQPDGSVRSSDNWQKGIPMATYAKGLARHHLHFGIRHRGFHVTDPLAAGDMEEDLCAIIFNAQGALFELLKDKASIKP